MSWARSAACGYESLPQLQKGTAPSLPIHKLGGGLTIIVIGRNSVSARR